jgi:Fungal specific transcription factor domain
MLEVAIRIAQRMGIHTEATYARSTAFEAEMCRKLWWSLVVFDNRICEMSDHKSTMLTPIRVCRPPLNVNDSDMHLEMKKPPAVHDKPTEALFALVWSELAVLVRHSNFYFDFTHPSLKMVISDTALGTVLHSGELIDLKKNNGWQIP